MQRLREEEGIIASPRLKPDPACGVCLNGPCARHTGYNLFPETIQVGGRTFSFKACLDLPGRLPGGKNQTRLAPRHGKWGRFPVRRKKDKPTYFERWREGALNLAAACRAKGMSGEVALRVRYDGTECVVGLYESEAPYKHRQHQSDVDASLGAIMHVLEKSGIIADDRQVRQVLFTDDATSMSGEEYQSS